MAPQPSIYLWDVLADIFALVVGSTAAAANSDFDRLLCRRHWAALHLSPPRPTTSRACWRQHTLDATHPQTERVISMSTQRDRHAWYDMGLYEWQCQCPLYVQKHGWAPSSTGSARSLAGWCLVWFGFSESRLVRSVAFSIPDAQGIGMASQVRGRQMRGPRHCYDLTDACLTLGAVQCIYSSNPSASVARAIQSTRHPGSCSGPGQVQVPLA